MMQLSIKQYVVMNALATVGAKGLFVDEFDKRTLKSLVGREFVNLVGTAKGEKVKITKEGRKAWKAITFQVN